MSDLYEYLGACMGPQEILRESRCSEIVSVAILGQKRSRSSYMACGVFHPIFGCPCMHFLSQLTSNSMREGTKVWQNSRWADSTTRTTLERLN